MDRLEFEYRDGQWWAEFPLQADSHLTKEVFSTLFGTLFVLKLNNQEEWEKLRHFSHQMWQDIYGTIPIHGEWGLFGDLPSGEPEAYYSQEWSPNGINKKVCELDNGVCCYCGNPASGVDHLLPQSRGGENTIENLASCCTQCNSRKGTKTPEEAGMILQFGRFANHTDTRKGAQRHEESPSTVNPGDSR